MTALQKCKQINQAFIHRYLPMDDVVAQCGSDLLFRDGQGNLISVRVSCVSKDRETELIQSINDKTNTLKEKEIEYNKTLDKLHER